MYMDKTYPNACIVIHMELYRYVLVAPKLALSFISPTIQGTSPNIGKHVLFLKSKIHMTPIYGSYSVGFHMDLKIMYTHLIARIQKNC